MSTPLPRFGIGTSTAVDLFSASGHPYSGDRLDAYAA